MRSALAATFLTLATVGCGPTAALAATLSLEGSIPLADVLGRIDHLAIDLARRHLFVAELGNNSVDVVDLASGKVIQRIGDLNEPQGIEYIPGADAIVVAGGGDGVVSFFSGADFSLLGSVSLGGDADNVHLDPQTGSVMVGYGNGGLAILDPARRVKIADVALPGHPEGFGVSVGGVYVNVPSAAEIAVVDPDKAAVVTEWPMALSENFPMALDPASNVLAAVFRDSSTLGVFDLDTGAVIAQIGTCGDADDVFFDASRSRLYVSCGAGAIDVLARKETTITLLERVATSGGTRTSLFVPQLDRLFVARRAGSGSGAAIEVYRPE